MHFIAMIADHTKNISESGALISGPADLPLGGRIILHLKMPAGNIIKTKGAIVRVSKKEGAKETTIAVKFSDIAPVDLMNLRNFIEQELNKPRQG